jgi:MFS family permease
VLYLGATYYISSWYKRRELSWRVSILFSAATLAGTFGGILAFGINNMNGLGGQEGWRWIFYIEGIVTVIVAVLAFFFINDFPSDRPKFLTESECDRVLVRLRTDAGPGGGEHFSWKQVGSAFLDWKVYIWSLNYIGICVPLLSLSVFLPTIIQNLGFISYKAQLLTAPPYAFAFITTMITAYFSDKYARRGIFILFWLLITMIGFIIFLVANNLGVKYFAAFLTAGGIPPCVATCITFLSCNISPQTKRATSLAFMISVGNCGGIISGQIYRTQDEPRFMLGHAINLGFCTLAIICTSILMIGLRLENRRRNHLYGSVTNSAMANANTTVDIFGLGSSEDRRRWGYENMSEEQIRDLGDKHAAWRYIL